MTAFKKTNIQIFSKPRPPITPEAQYWNSLGAPVILKEFGTISYVDFSPIDPYYFAVTCSVRVQLYNPITRCVAKNFNKFRENAYGGSFRSDGMLLVAGGEEGILRLFDVNSKTLLRVFKGHTGPVHRTFFTSDKTHLVSFSDDKTVSTWDVPCEKQIQIFSGHNDYVRAGCPSPVSPNVLLSGSYDGNIRMFDDRKGIDPVFTIDHGAPVESIVSLPSGGIFISAGGTDIKVWDIINGGRMIANITQHHKTVTCLCITYDGNHFLSGSLDRHVKIFSISSYQPVHTFDYPNAVLSVGVSPNEETVVAGMVDGLISVRRRATEVVNKKPVKNKVSSRFFGDSSVQYVDYIVIDNPKLKLKSYDFNLMKFRYDKALSIAFSKRTPPNVTVSVMLELIRRKGLHQAVAGSVNMEKVLKFVLKFIGDYKFTRVLIDVTSVLFDVYEPEMDTLPPNIKDLFKALQRRINEEYELTLNLVALQGALQMILATSSIPITDSNLDAEKAMDPSTAAQETFVVNIA